MNEINTEIHTLLRETHINTDLIDSLSTSHKPLRSKGRRVLAIREFTQLSKPAG